MESGNKKMTTFFVPSVAKGGTCLIIAPKHLIVAQNVVQKWIVKGSVTMADFLIIGGIVVAIILIYASLMKMASKEGENNESNSFNE
jgi:hypothetical protein